MKNILIIFENSLSNLNKEEVKEILEDLSFNLVYKIISENKIDNDEFLNQTLINFLNILEKLDILDEQNSIKVTKGLIKASILNDENQLYKYIDEAALLEKKIENQKNLIKNKLSKNFLEFEKSILKSNYNDEIKNCINDVLLFDIEMLGILKETSESAFLNTLEDPQDIELTSFEISKNLVYNAICEANFEKERILKIAKIVLNSAFEISNEALAYSKELCKGAIKGVQEGISLSIEKIKNQSIYAALEEDILSKSKELVGIEDEFIILLKNEAIKQKNPSSQIIQDLLNNELNTNTAKLKRLAQESREQLLLILNEVRKNPKIDDFNKLAQRKIINFKQEIIDLEKLASEKYKDFSSKKAKKLGKIAWEKAKKFIKKN